MSKNKILGAFSIISSISILAGVTYSIMCDNQDSINHFLNIETSKIVNVKDSNQDTLYFKSEYGDHKLTDENFDLLRKDALAQGIKEEEEGAVLLYNKNHALPLKETTATLLGHASVDPVYKSNSAGNYVNNNTPDVITLPKALENNGITINNKVLDKLSNGKAKRTTRVISEENKGMAYSSKGSEENLSFYESLKSDISNNELAIITLARQAGEGLDLLMKDTDDEGGKEGYISSLSLHKNEIDLLKFAKDNFKKVIVLLNSPYQMEVEGIKEYADAILAIGQPGLTGFQGVANILTGKVSPSGRLVDTYATNSLSSPAVINSGTNTPLYENLDDIYDEMGENELASLASFQVENIYIGYKYYETRYEDCVLNRYGANSIKGSTDGLEWNYSKEISYPFGYGLTYTTFNEKIDSYSINEDDINIKVKVTNTGNVASKHVVEVYGQTPYGTYEKNNNIEKSSIQLFGFAKTKELAPEESETVEITINKYFLASYDTYGKKTYIISEGTNYLALGNDAHDALNNILVQKGVTSNLVDQDGNNVLGDKDNVISFDTEFDYKTYSVGENNTKVTNIFSECDINNLQDKKYTYLSRCDWDKTFPTSQTKISANDKMIKLLKGDYYTKSNYSPSIKSVKTGESINRKLVDMKDVPYDSPLWDDFINQINIDELANVMVQSFVCPNIDSIMQPKVKTGDGMDSIGATYFYKDGSKKQTMTYACKNILSSTYNVDLYRRRGELMGEESLFTKMFENYCIGPNLHRTPFGGRNFEYISEDPIMTFLASIPEVEGMESKGAHAAPKHFAGNDQETGREGVSVFFTEQSFRENDLRAFEGALRFAKSGGVMQSFERVGLRFASSSSALNKDLLRKEWGFNGNIVTDATYGATQGYKGHVMSIVNAGSEQFCLDGNVIAGKRVINIVKETNDGSMLKNIQQIAKNWEYAISHSLAMNDIESNTKFVDIIPWWKIVMISIISSTEVIGISLFGLSFIKLKRED